MARVLVALSGGVDSSVAAALLLEEGHDVVGATLKLWGGRSDSGCCSVSDVEDARRVADRLGIEHHVFNYTEEFDRHVVRPYVGAHVLGETPNPCIECNRHVKFDALLSRATRLGFDLLATGHHARVARDEAGEPALFRGRDRRKDQSYVLSCLERPALDRLVLPVGEFSKDTVREIAAKRHLVTAGKPDSQEVCFVAGGSSRGARRSFLAERIDLHPGEVRDACTGSFLGEVPAVELVTVGQRRGLGVAAGGRLFAIDVDVARRLVTVGDESMLERRDVALERRTWTAEALEAGEAVRVQASAHGASARAELTAGGVRLEEGRRRVAPGQTLALYDVANERVLGSGVVTRERAATR